MDALPTEYARLVEAARAARQHAYAPYSRFQVGAALLTAGGEVYTGCNVENASYGATICAERTAVGAAIAAGERDFAAIAVIADTPAPVSPCGVCRQVLSEFGADLVVIMANLQGATKIATMQELLPQGFTGHDLADG